MKHLFDDGSYGDARAQPAATRTRRRRMAMIALSAILVYQACLWLLGWHMPLSPRRLRFWQNIPETSESQHGQAEFDWLEVSISDYQIA